MGIKEKKLIPKYYLQRVAVCDDCNEELQDTGQRLLSSPLQWSMRCPKCKKFYHILETKLQSEWIWEETE